MFFEGQFAGMSSGRHHRRRPRAIERHGERRQPVVDAGNAAVRRRCSSPARGRTGACSRCAGAGSRRARRSACAGGSARRSRSAVRGRWGGSPRAPLRRGPLLFPCPRPAAEAAACRPGRRSRPAPSARRRPARARAARGARRARASGRRRRRITRRTPCGGRFAQLEQHAAGRGGVQEGDQVAARARARRLVNQANARRLQRRERAGAGRRPRSRRGAGRGRGARGSAPAPRCRRARRSRRRRRRPPASPACRNATSVFCPATVSRAPAVSPNSVDRSLRGGVTIRDGDRDVIDSLDLDHWGRGAGGVDVERRSRPKSTRNLPGTAEGLQMIEISDVCYDRWHAFRVAPAGRPGPE